MSFFGEILDCLVNYDSFNNIHNMSNILCHIIYLFEFFKCHLNIKIKVLSNVFMYLKKCSCCKKKNRATGKLSQYKSKYKLL